MPPHHFPSIKVATGFNEIMSMRVLPVYKQAPGEHNLLYLYYSSNTWCKLVYYYTSVVSIIEDMYILLNIVRIGCARIL